MAPQAGRLNRTLEKVTHLPYNVVSRRGAITDSAKRKLFEQGISGQAQILEAPGDNALSDVKENLGRFLVRVEIPGRDPYEATVIQSFRGGYESAGLKQGALVECRVDMKNDERVLLIAPEPDERRVTAVDSSAILANGERATATVERARKLEARTPGSGDPIYELVMKMTSERETKPWKVRIGQRVPKGAEDLVKGGRELTAPFSRSMTASRRP